MKRYLTVLFAVAAAALLVDPAFAQDMPAEAAASAAGTSAKAWYFTWMVITSGFAMAIASSFCAMAQSKAITMALEGIARQPAAAGRIQTVMVIGLALIESLAIYVLLIALLLFFVKPFDTSVLGL